MTQYQLALAALRERPRRWLVTGAAGFIGSNLVEALLAANQSVVGLDNFATGRRGNLDLAITAAGQSEGAGKRIEFVEGDIRSAEVCRIACRDVEIVLHQAAQVSVPASVQDPSTTHEINVTGFLNVLEASRQAGVKRIVYASSCAVYGDSANLPLSEAEPARPLSPYAASKLANEDDAAAHAPSAGITSMGLRYFNVFGPRQDPKGVYAAVIPLWISTMLQHQAVRIFGDGSSSRDFCPVANVVQANLLAATTGLAPGAHEVINVALGSRTSLNELFEAIRARLEPEFPHLRDLQPVYEPFRPGDIRHSHARIDKAQNMLGYSPSLSVEQGLTETIKWFRQSASPKTN